MIKKIKELEILSRQLNPDASKRKDYLMAVQAYADEFLNSIEDRPSFNESDNKGQDTIVQEDPLFIQPASENLN